MVLQLVMQVSQGCLVEEIVAYELSKQKYAFGDGQLERIRMWFLKMNLCTHRRLTGEPLLQ